MCAAARAEGAQYTLSSAALQVTIDLDTGAIVDLRDLARPSSPAVFGAGESVLALSAGSARPAPFGLTGSAPNSVTVASPSFLDSGGGFALRTTIVYRLVGNRLSVEYEFEATGRVALDSGLNIDIASAVWDTVLVRNHFSGEDPFVLGASNPLRNLALNQVYELRNATRIVALVFPNPYHSLVTIAPVATHSFKFTWRALAATAPLQAVDPKGPPFASVLPAGTILRRQVDIIVAHHSDASSGLPMPVAYFSPCPNGYDQTIAMTFDDIPFGRWIFPVSGHDPNAPMEQYLIRLLEDHPRMKQGWVVLPDEIYGASELANPDYPPGKWWLAHGIRRVLTHAPPAYLQWLRNVGRDSLVYGYEHRVLLGSHGYHHTAEGFGGRNFEFQSYDTTGNDSTFATIAREFSLFGLGPRCLRWIRFPGFFFTRSAIESLIKFGYVFFDYWGIYDKLPWMQFYSDHGRIWGAGTLWEGDTPSPYAKMEKILAAGKLCHTSGHPNAWFDGEPDTAYAQISGEFTQAEAEFPNLGYMFPPDVGDFANQTCDLRGFETQVARSAFIFSFTGAATLGQTIDIEWPADRSAPAGVTIDGGPPAGVQTRGRRLVIVVPPLAEGQHTVRVAADLQGWYDVVSIDEGTPSSLALSQNYPNPFNPTTSIEYAVPFSAHVRLAIYTSAGERVVVLVDEDEAVGVHTATWDGRDDAGRAVASGVYFCRIEALGEARVRKLVLMR